MSHYKITVLKGFEFKKRDTIIHMLDPRTKAVYVFVMSAITLLFTTPIPIMITFLSSLIVVIIAKVIREWTGTMKGIIVLSLFIFAVNYLVAPIDKLNYAISMTMRLIALTSIFSIFFLTTSPEDFSLALLKLGVPYEYTLIFTMALRFIPTLARDLQMIIDAQRSRGLELEKGNIIQRIKRFLPILVPLVVYEIKRSFMVAEALEARAFGAVEFRTYFYEIKMKPIDWTLSILLITLLTLVIYLCYMNMLPEWVFWKIPS